MSDEKKIYGVEWNNFHETYNNHYNCMFLLTEAEKKEAEEAMTKAAAAGEIEDWSIYEMDKLPGLIELLTDLPDVEEEDEEG